MTTFAERVRLVISSTAAGEVMTYGEVAAEAGRPGAARAVGNVLAHSEGLPWWRIVNASGRMAPGKEAAQARLLAGEGVVVDGARVRRPPARVTTGRRRRAEGRATGRR